jgi:hypothetical protein
MGRLDHSVEGIMQIAIAFMAVVAGMVFSMAMALLAEELIFAQVMRRLFRRRPVELKSGHKR